MSTVTAIRKYARTLKWILVVCACLISSLAALAEVDLTPEQKDHAARLYALYYAPCCWRESVALHRSPEATKLRSEIDLAIVSGKSDSEIKDALIKEYGHGILLEKEGARSVLVYSLPVVAVLVGLYMCARWLHRTRPQPATSKDSSGINLDTLPYFEDEA